MPFIQSTLYQSVVRCYTKYGLRARETHESHPTMVHITSMAASQRISRIETHICMQALHEPVANKL